MYLLAQVLIAQLKEKSDECESKVSGAERDLEEALEDKKRSDFQNTQAQLQASAKLRHVCHRRVTVVCSARSCAMKLNRSPR